MRKLLKYNEYYTGVIAVVLFFLSPYALRWIDPTAAAFDAGVLQEPILGIVKFCILQAFAWLTLKLVWPHLRGYMENTFNEHFMTLTPWEKLRLSVFVYLSLLYFLVLLSKI